jgi:hypothetical protein
MSASAVGQDGVKLGNMESQSNKKVATKQQNYKGFVAGVFSGVAKLTGIAFFGSSFDTAY